MTPIGQMSLGGTDLVILQAERRDLKEDISPPERRENFFPAEGDQEGLAEETVGFTSWV